MMVADFLSEFRHCRNLPDFRIGGSCPEFVISERLEDGVKTSAMKVACGKAVISQDMCLPE
jgi:hypothetical protein